MATAPKPFYYQLDGTIIGPVTGIELRDAALAGIVLPATLIANDPNGNWVAAIRIRGFFDERGRPLPHPPETKNVLSTNQSSTQIEPFDAQIVDDVTEDDTNETKTGTRSASETQHDVAEFVIEHADELDVPGVKNFVEEHGRLGKKLAEAKDRQKRLVRAKQEYEPLEQHVDKCRRELKDAETELSRLHRPLGGTAFKAFLRAKSTSSRSLRHALPSTNGCKCSSRSLMDSLPVLMLDSLSRPNQKPSNWQS